MTKFWEWPASTKADPIGPTLYIHCGDEFATLFANGSSSCLPCACKGGRNLISRDSEATGAVMDSARESAAVSLLHMLSTLPK